MSPTIGLPLSRADGHAKVTGRARYTADTQIDGLTYGVFALSTIPHGRLTRLSTAAAERAPGVLMVLTHRNMPPLRALSHPPAGQSYMPLQQDRIRYEGQPIALVVAETLEQALHAASLVQAEYTPEPAVTDFRRVLDTAFTVTSFAEPDTQTGDVAQALAQAAVRLEQTYRTADRHHNPMEPSATIAVWHDGKLTLYDATQWVWGVRMVVARALGLPPEDVQVRSSFLGGGFGCKGYVWPHQILTAVAAREVGRAVKVVLTRAQTYTAHGYQPGSAQTVTLGATRDGQLVAIRHTSVTPTSPFDDYVEYAAIGTRSLYACPAIATQHRAVRVYRSTPTPMRAPHEGLSMLGLECALDELAVQLGIDPVALRLRNYADTDPTSGKPFSSKALRACYVQGAERFGWARRTPAPGSMRDGRDLVGWGMASAIMSTFRFPATARVTLEKGGTVLIAAGTQEIGTGVYTIMPQIAADVLGLPVERIRLVLGDTTLPETGGTFGSSTTMGVGSAVHDAATKLKAQLTQLAGGKTLDSPEAYDAVLAHHALDQLSTESAWSPGITVERLGLDAGVRALSAEGAWTPGAHASPLGEVPEWSMHTFGAVFVEVRIDEDLRIPRLSRCVGVYSAGRIINPKTARSQMLGGIIWGVGQALLEHSAMDHTLGRYLSKNLSGYLVPVHADIPELEVAFVDEVDAYASVLGAKGIGELGAVGVGPAVANAVWHATGIRVHEVPITPEMLVG